MIRGPAIVALSLVCVPAPASEELSGFDCLIEPDAVVEVATREIGILESVLVDRGDAVETGEPLAVLESSVEQATVELAKARANMSALVAERRESKGFAERQLTRSQRLHEQKSIPEHEFDQASTEARLASLRLRQTQHDQRVAALELKRAQASLARRTVHSPVTGVVVEKLLNVGESVEDRPILTLARVDPLRVEVIVPVEQFGRIKVGMRAQVMPLVRGGTRREAIATVVDAVVDAASSTFGVRLELPNPERSLPGGLKCEIRFIP